MIPPRSDNRSWVRKVDGDMHVVGPTEQPQTRWYPGNLSELLWIVTRHLEEPAPTHPEAKVCGSHWAMSKAAVTPGQMIETATPVHESTGDQSAPRLNEVLHEVIPACMSPQAIAAFMKQDVPEFDPTAMPDKEKYYLFHVESGMRIYELYSYMDSGDDGRNERSLAWLIEHLPITDKKATYLGPWALETMGGAGGQTIAGVASTATHGGDILASAISDAIVALHLIAPDGQEYWIERKTILPNQQFNLVDEGKLKALYAPRDPSKPGGAFRAREIVYLQDDDLINAAIVSCGRMGIIYSVVVRAIRQFALHQETLTPFWHEVRTWLSDPSNATNVANFGNHFLRIDVDVYPKPVFDWSTAAWLFGTGVFGGLPLAVVGLYAGIRGDEYRTWLISRQFQPLQAANKGSLAAPRYHGRQERSGPNKGATQTLEKWDEEGGLRDPCGAANWLKQFLEDVSNELEGIRNDALLQWVVAGGVIAATAITFPAAAQAARAYQQVLERVMLFCQVWILVFAGIRAALPNDMPFGDFLASLMNTFAGMNAHSIVQLMYWIGSNSEHGGRDKPFTAISYAVMDEHNYKNKGCIAPGDSIEFFMDANAPGLVSFIDYALGEVRNLADDGEGFGGYISLRFMKDSPSFLAMQRWSRTCSIEIAGLSKIDGTGPLLERLEAESLKRGIVLHWGQRNHRAQADLEKVFNPAPGGAFHRWRAALSTLSEHGRLDNFSTDYSRYKGLEITEPRLYSLTASLTDGCENEVSTISYDAFRNPPGTELILRQRYADGRAVALPVSPGTLKGSVGVRLGRGRSIVQLHAVRRLNGNKYFAPPLEVELQGFATGDAWNFQFEAEKRKVDGVDRWYVEMNLFSQFISNSMRVSAVTLATAATGEWILRNPDLGADQTFATANSTVQLPTLPIFNRNWRYFSKAPAMGTVPPTVSLHYTIDC